MQDLVDQHHALRLQRREMERTRVLREHLLRTGDLEGRRAVARIVNLRHRRIGRREAKILRRTHPAKKARP